MRGNPILFREKGELINLKHFESMLPKHVWTPTGVLSTSCSEVSSTRLVWIRGHDNFLLSLDALGRAVLHSIFPGTRVKINQPNERVVKMALSDDSLFVIATFSQSDFSRFFVINCQSLQVFEPVRQPVFQSLFVHIDEIEEFDIEYSWLVIRKIDSLQLWCVDSSTMQYEFSTQGTVYSKYYVILLVSLEYAFYSKQLLTEK